MTTSAEVRTKLVRELGLDLVGPRNDDPELANETLPEPPSRWYMTGFLVPIGAPERQLAPDPQEEMDEAEEGGADDNAAPERGPGRRSWLPSSMGLSLLVEEGTPSLRATVRWGDYRREGARPHADSGSVLFEEAAPSSQVEDPGADKGPTAWRRFPREASVEVPLSAGRPIVLPEAGGIELARHVRPTRIRIEDGERAVLALSLFVVNRRVPIEDPGREDEAKAFQVEIEVEGQRPFVARANPKGMGASGIDARIGDLHYRDVVEWAVGHNVSVAPLLEDGTCRRVRTAWLPEAYVPRIEVGQVEGVERRMEALGALADGAAARAALGRLPGLYQSWIETRAGALGDLAPPRREVAEALLNDARRAHRRMQDGIALLDDPNVLDAFRIMNRAIAAAARKRRPDETPTWRPFQLAFILLNMRGLVEPAHADRETVDLLFFPTGGGKTEAYLGLAAFVIVWRRLIHPGRQGCGLAVLMRYTLRLLTLDQLGRAAAVVCALELERRGDPERLGDWPFEIGLWVGRAATPNRMGEAGDRDETTARARVLKYRRDTSSFPPIPIESCPWCGTKFDPNSFRLVPNTNNPSALLLCCANRRCEFAAEPGLPVLTVDEPIYRRLPAFMIATADKFAAMPWVGEVASFFGRADRSDDSGFYGPAEPVGGRPLPAPLAPPDLIIQDELHLIAGPLGSMAGLYETALDALCVREIEGRRIRPKIIASTATVRRAQTQIRALFDRTDTAVFPPPGPDRRDSFFACIDEEPDRSRLYLGLAAPGRSPKVLFLRATTTLLAAARKAWLDAGGPVPGNSADPYMTLVAYFNALRELGSARRIVEDEVRTRISGYASRVRIGEIAPRFADRDLKDPLELTSRVGTVEVADAKERLAVSFDRDRTIDVALATNMVSVGLDVVRLGLMLVSGQPKTAAEYIQATSRVGRDRDRPGLVVTLLNLNKPRDRSHYERFTSWHAAFYRAVEAVSVTPFASRALDRGLAPATVALARLGQSSLTPLAAAGAAERERGQLDHVIKAFGQRARDHHKDVPPELEAKVRATVASLLDDWASLAHDRNADGTAFGYAALPGVTRALLREMLDPELALADPREQRFRAPRSLRDVEPNVLLRKVAPNGAAIGDDA